MLSTCPILLEELWRDSPVARLSDVFDDGHVLYDAVIEHGLEGIVTKLHGGAYRPGYRGWTKVKNPSYWRREGKVAQMQRSRERRVRLTSAFSGLKTSPVSQSLETTMGRGRHARRQ